MVTRAARLIFASALIVFLLAQPFAALAFDDCSVMSCCKDKCCRKMHPASTGPGFTSKDCCGQCHISVRNTQPVAASIGPEPASEQLAPAPFYAAAYKPWLPSVQPSTVLFERPPPSVA